ncbi:MAG TPA: T9SS type A sorting domain-containing protein [Ferruginibacter sp.]|nr:T9SS type A sorting domain-containing protein [Ferruginibacter sp.]
MKQKILFTITLFLFFAANAQKKGQKVTAYAITGTEKGSSNWTEVRLVDVSTGEEIRSIYKSAQETPVLNARTGKPIVKKDNAALKTANEVIAYRIPEKADSRDLLPSKKEVILFRDGKDVMTNVNNSPDIHTNINTDVHTRITLDKKVYATYAYSRVSSDKPFSTYSAACAYDKKHERLYYTPMGINQLRYIDLKSGSISYFEDEPFGALKDRGDVSNQVTRMVIGSDGNGYALTNNAEHLIRFTTKKNTEITDLGPLSDNEATNSVSVHSRGGYGGDIVAGEKGMLYLVTANRNVFEIDINSRVAVYKGAIQGLPAGFTTNGAIVESGSNIIVTSSTSTKGYYRFDLNTLRAEKVSSNESVFNASDLANANLVSSKKKKEVKEEEQTVEVKEQPLEVKEEALVQDKGKVNPQEIAKANKISVYPNPVTNGIVNILFTDYPAGKYEVQFMEVSGKILSTQQIVVNAKVQSKEFKLPGLIARGNYLLKVVNETNKVINVEQLVVQ